jgi:hypothetical protein
VGASIAGHLKGFFGILTGIIEPADVLSINLTDIDSDFIMTPHQ